MFRIVIDSLIRCGHLAGLSKRRTCIEIAVILREGAGSDFQADAMAGFEDLGRVPAVDVDAIASAPKLDIIRNCSDLTASDIL